ncbi:hypothetical protein [Burkholderia pseudomallei]|uniref:hypothetical protein n=1 Tax=Burkholderia pseudomallei TaxID=28450 RepID=UPI00105BEBD0|nr:hypothetical protein [Burkholderia pseudomallei]
MAARNKTGNDLPVVYKFKDQGFFAIACLAIASFFTFIAVIVARSAGTTALQSWLIFVLPTFFLIGAIISLRNKSQIIIRDASISRRFLGVTWQQISWSDICLIRVVPFFHPGIKRTVRTITLVATNHRRMSFIDEVDGIDDLINSINAQVKLRGIEIHVNERDRKYSVPHL